MVGGRELKLRESKLLDFVRGGRELGFGIEPGTMTEHDVREGYRSLTTSLAHFSALDQYQQYRVIAHSLAYLAVLEFENAHLSLGDAALCSRDRAELQQDFLHFAATRPSRVRFAEERTACIEALVATGKVQRTWYEARPYERREEHD